MSVEWFDLAQRLHAARTGTPVARLRHTPFTRAISTVAVRATIRAGVTTVSVAADRHATRTATDADGLSLLADCGATIAAAEPVLLLVDDAATLPVLEKLARHWARDSDDSVSGAAAMCGWWADRAAHPGTSAVVDLVGASRSRFVLGVDPDAETRNSVWRNWLGIVDDSCSGMHEWADIVGAGTVLLLLDPIHEDDAYRLAKMRELFTDGIGWNRPDNPASAAMGLRSRCDAADLWAGALLSDPLWRRRAVHTGHVATGTAKHTAKKPGSAGRASIAVACDRLDSRLRVGTKVAGWVGGPEDQPFERFFADVKSATVAGGGLRLDLGAISTHAPTDGARVCVMPQPPSPQTLRAGRSAYYALYARRSWLSTGRTPALQRRDVPLDVLIAGAED
ncbi:hypothetical protein [Antrihabitans spumae]|uniref:Uncharacterized protein n=1 Tax=Antrihabitans spumae TaxID=3373370 RepID=A0ABW7JPR0_9NOCA